MDIGQANTELPNLEKSLNKVNFKAIWMKLYY